MYKRIFLMLLIVLMISTPIYAESRNWQPVNYSDPELIQESGLTIEEFNQLIKEDWEELLTDKKEVSFAFLALDEEGNNITNKINPDLFINVIGYNDTKKARFRAVDFVNSAPRLLDINNQTIYETELFLYQVNAEDIDNDELTYSIVNENELPEKLTINQEGLIEWQTDYLSEGVYTIVVGVSDGELTSEEDLTLTVKETNYVPVLNDLDMQLVNENELLEFQIPATDIDEDTLTFSSDDLPEGSDLSDDGLFTWKPDYSDSGEYTFNVEVSDGLDTDSNIYSVKVEDVNVAPEFTNVKNQTIKENEFFSYQLEASDIDGNDLTYSITNLEELPSGITINEGLIEWNQSIKPVGNYTVNLQVSDGYLVDNATFELIVEKVSIGFENYHNYLSFNGTNDYYEIPNHENINESSSTNQETIEVFFQTGDNISSRQILYEEGGALNGLNIYIYNNYVYFGAWGLSNDWGFKFVKTPIETNTNYKATLVFDSIKGELVGYLNNNKVGMVNGLGALPTHSNEVAIGARNGDSFYETGSDDVDRLGNFFKGKIYEVRNWYERALTHEEILEYAGNTLSGNENGLEGLWIPEENTDQYLKDHTGNGHTGVNYWIYSLDLNGDYAALNDYYNTTQNKFTVETWVKTTNNGIIASFDRSEYWRFGIGSNGTSGKVTFNTYYDDCSGKTTVNDGQWHHIAGVYNNGTVKLYVDGKLDNTCSGLPTSPHMGDGTKRYGFIGSGSEASSYDGNKNSIGFDGKIKNLRVWNGARSESAINLYRKYNVPQDTSSLYLLFRLNEGKGNIVNDIARGKKGEIIGSNYKWVKDVPFF